MEVWANEMFISFIPLVGNSCKKNKVTYECIYLQLLVGGCMSYLRYLCLFAYSGVQHILCGVFALSFFILCPMCRWLLWIILFLSLRYSLTFMYMNHNMLVKLNIAEKLLAGR